MCKCKKSSIIGSGNAQGDFAYFFSLAGVI